MEKNFIFLLSCALILSGVTGGPLGMGFPGFYHNVYDDGYYAYNAGIPMDTDGPILIFHFDPGQDEPEVMSPPSFALTTNVVDDTQDDEEFSDDMGEMLFNMFFLLSRMGDMNKKSVMKELGEVIQGLQKIEEHLQDEDSNTTEVTTPIIVDSSNDSATLGGVAVIGVIAVEETYEEPADIDNSLRMTDWNNGYFLGPTIHVIYASDDYQTTSDDHKTPSDENEEEEDDDDATSSDDDDEKDDDDDDDLEAQTKKLEEKAKELEEELESKEKELEEMLEAKAKALMGEN